ncbi:hypothetical protein EHQ05_03445 [Leptospira yasudae]|uniref:hypothetical protein n=1 Tax=Leptospira yasudae TaxID=2202201 RepID=UPI0010834376|nr:hypothetical protein [Leptospira yasudae]TGK30028.1 hypothetical protein EHQ05_03445 [Leptospira yasudae]TGM07345.1 hypothetical protein EHQ86_04570 [Leptospira yasudae]
MIKSKFIQFFASISAVCFNHCSLLYDKGPHYFLPPIAVEYYQCDKCKSYIGGIFGKGPLFRYKSEQAKRCIHSWEEIDADLFQQKIHVDHQVDLSKNDQFQRIQKTTLNRKP